MRVLFDHGTPSGVADWLVGHDVTEARERGWDKISNGELLKAAEEAGFDVLLTTDKNMAQQQNLKNRSIAIVVLGNSQWRIVQRHVRRVTNAVTRRRPAVVSKSKSPSGSRL
jgi:predicted nuclease of predicted toxin-antitoxin system